MKVRMSLEQQDKDKLIDKIIDKYHFTDGDRETLIMIYGQLKKYIEPYASYRINQRITGVPDIDDGPSAMVSMTLGAGVDRLQERYIRDDRLEEAYMLDCICAELLLLLYGEFNRSYARFHRRYVKRYVFIGDEIPLTAIPGILTDIRGKKTSAKKNDNAVSENTEEISDTISDSAAECERLMEHDEITCNEYGVLTPSKSVVFYAVLSENPNQMCEGICDGCCNAECENRLKVVLSYDKPAGNNISEIPEDKGSRLTYGYQRIFGTR